MMRSAALGKRFFGHAQASRRRPAAWLAAGLALAVVAGGLYVSGGGEPGTVRWGAAWGEAGIGQTTGGAVPATTRLVEGPATGQLRGAEVGQSRAAAEGADAKGAADTAARGAAGAAPAPASVQGSAQGSRPGVAGTTASFPVLPPLPPSDRLIVKTGSISLQVADLTEGVRRVGEVVAAVPGAYVAASSTSYRGGAAAPGAEGVIPGLPRPGPAPGQSATLTIKVPAGDFGPAMERLRALGTPLQEQVSTQEVTEEYVDLEAQIRNLEALEQQYLRLLERAQRVEEIIPLQQRAAEVRTQIDRLRGRLNLLQRRADLSTISVSLVLSGRPGDPGLVPEPRPVRTLRLALGQLGLFLQALLDLAIYVGVLLIPFLPLGAAVYWWRRARRPAPPAPSAAPTA